MEKSWELWIRLSCLIHSQWFIFSIYFYSPTNQSQTIFLNQHILDCLSLNKSWHDPENLARTSMVLHLASHTSCVLKEWKAFLFLYLASLVNTWRCMHYHVCACSAPHMERQPAVSSNLCIICYDAELSKIIRSYFYWNMCIYQFISFYQ